MRKINLFLFLTLTVHVLTAQSTSKKTTDNFNKLKWIEGTWTRVNNESGQSGIEIWQKISPHEFRGKGVTLKGSDTLFVEKLQLILKEDNIFYVSDVPENPNPVPFKLTELTSIGFAGENPQHDFPKKISYQLSGKLLTATISGDGKFIDYYFKKN